MEERIKCGTAPLAATAAAPAQKPVCEEAVMPSPRKSEFTFSRLVACCFVVLFAFVFVRGRSYPREASLFPTLVGSLGFLLAAWLALFDPESIADTRDPTAEAAAESTSSEGRRRRLLLGACSPLVYSLLVWFCGFYPATLSVLLGLPFLLGFRDLRILIPVAIAVLFVLVALFSYAMELPLPMGVIGDWVLARFVYTD